ncbi:MAG TPA: DNA methyltransferase, partial [Rubricoccaceae bacterium]
MPRTTIHVGDCLETLRTLPSASVHCCVTSPPYFGLRDYGTASWDGGDPDCDHRRTTLHADRNEDRPKIPGSHATNSGQVLTEARRSRCETCGAVKTDSQIGLEPTPAEFVAALVAVFAEVWRVLRDDGTLWLNLGDSYATAAGSVSRETTRSGFGSRAGHEGKHAGMGVPTVG